MENINYEQLYYMLFNSITDALHLLDQGQTEHAIIRLALGQQQAEEIIMAQP